MAIIVTSALERTRKAQGLSQQSLAQAAGITRQAVSAVESGRMQPSVGIALALTRALGTTVEELFGREEDASPAPRRVATATIAGRTVTHSLLDGDLAIEPAESPGRTVFVAGCDPAAGLLSRRATTRVPNTRVLWLNMTNRAALDALARQEVHAAVIHGEVASWPIGPSGNLMRFEIATTEEGWLFGAGNPLGFRTGADIVRKKARLANRPAGAGARDVLDEQLLHAKVDPRRVAGYDRELPGQLDAGRAIAYGFADVAIGMASIARSFNLGFAPLREERCALFLPRAGIRTPEIRALLETLRSTSYRRDLEAYDAYGVTRIGEPA